MRSNGETVGGDGGQKRRMFAPTLSQSVAARLSGHEALREVGERSDKK